jgi:hypothetical protein
MAHEELQLLHRLMADVRALRDEVGSALPTVCSRKRAAKELDISVAKLKGMERRGQITRVPVGDGWGVPRDEILRIAGKAKETPAPRGPPRRRVKHDALGEAAELRAALKEKP